jgi:hypothetical protein
MLQICKGKKNIDIGAWFLEDKTKQKQNNKKGNRSRLWLKLTLNVYLIIKWGDE